MAKIRARGAHEVARFKHRSSGLLFLVRSDGVVLWKSTVPGDSWKVHMTRSTLVGITSVGKSVAYYREHPDYEEVRR